jgi:capsular exopolysaccharide synthesis family protein
MTTIDARARAQLTDAVRAIMVMAGLTDATAPQLAISRPAATAVAAGPIGARGLKGPRSLGGPVALDVPRPPKSVVIGVTSPACGDGKSTIAMALASCLAKDFGVECILLDADFETHSVGREFGLEGRRGLSDVIRGQSTFESVAHRFRGAPLTVMTAGLSRTEPARLARSESMPLLLERMRQLYAFVVVDLPAVLESTNAAVLGRQCDGVVVVSRAGSTSGRELDKSLALLRESHVMGVVLNRQRSSVPGWLDRLLGLPG